MPLTMSDTHSRSPAIKAQVSAKRFGSLLARLFLASFVSAIVVGSVGTGLQYVRVVPLILESEAFESTGGDPNNGTTAAENTSGDDEWAPADGAERGFYTWVSNLLVSLSFSLILVAICTMDNMRVDFRSGLTRGVAGWTICMALPCIGLSPELPGMAAADLSDRQWWWLYAVCFAAAGFAVALAASRLLDPAKDTVKDKTAVRRIWMRRNILQCAALTFGMLLAATPHLSGAPHPHVGHATDISTTCGSDHRECDRPGPPAEMAAAFSVWCLGTSFLYWLILGVTATFAFDIAMGYHPTIPNEVLFSTLHPSSAVSQTADIELEVAT
jgi:cobalt transporter subunit CbtA